MFGGDALGPLAVALPDGLENGLVFFKRLLRPARRCNGLTAGMLNRVMEAVKHVLQGPAF